MICSFLSVCWPFLSRTFSGERGIRTPGGVTLNGFQDRRNRPLCHLSRLASAKLIIFIYSAKFLPEFFVM